jgi:hypothetical protein
MKPELQEFLDGKGCYKRPNLQEAVDTLKRLGVPEGSLFHEFYCRYEGGFGSEYTGFMLMELCGEDQFTIEGASKICRQVHGFLNRHLVITDLVGDGMEVYDVVTNAVYSVDFEGGSDRLKEGTLEPTWDSFGAFLDFYFLGEIAPWETKS